MNEALYPAMGGDVEALENWAGVAFNTADLVRGWDEQADLAGECDCGEVAADEPERTSQPLP